MKRNPKVRLLLLTLLISEILAILVLAGLAAAVATVYAVFGLYAKPWYFPALMMSGSWFLCAVATMVCRRIGNRKAIVCKVVRDAWSFCPVLALITACGAGALVNRSQHGYQAGLGFAVYLAICCYAYLRA